MEERPQSATHIRSDLILFDFGKVAFGNLRFVPTVRGGTATIRFGELLLPNTNRIDQEPPGTIRYSSVVVVFQSNQTIIVAPPPDERNTEQVSDKHPPAVLTPSEWGTLTPFRWVEVEGISYDNSKFEIVRRAAFLKDWDDDASDFECSDETLNDIWKLCKYSIKATTFAGVYVDGDRERISYEADAHLNQLSHFYTDHTCNAQQMARDTFCRLVHYPTWPTEWNIFMVFMAWTDYMYTKDKRWLASVYEFLKTKLLLNRAESDGLITSNTEQQALDLVDWPECERDGFVFSDVNTVVNAFHLEALSKMEQLALALDKEIEAECFHCRRKTVAMQFQNRLFDPMRSLYRDGPDTDHCSFHSNLFSLAFGLVPSDRRPFVVEWLVSRGMRCSVYAAQYLLNGLFENGAVRAAIDLMKSHTNRSWKHMLESETTITWEAWDLKYKPNLDWNHAWGAAPANLLPKYVLGVQVLDAGWKRALIRPSPGELTFARGRIPTPRGSVWISYWRRSLEVLLIVITLPDGMSARVELPMIENATRVTKNGRVVSFLQKNSRWVLKCDVSGTVTLVLQ